MKIFFNFMQINMGNCSALSIEDLGQFFQSGTFRLHVEEVDEEKFNENPNLPSLCQCHVSNKRQQSITYRVD